MKNSSRAVLTRIGHEPGRLEAQGQTAVQCRSNEIWHQQENSSRKVLTLNRTHGPIGWNPGARQQFSAGKTRIFSSRPVAGQFQLKAGIYTFG